MRRQEINPGRTLQTVLDERCWKLGEMSFEGTTFGCGLGHLGIQEARQHFQSLVCTCLGETLQIQLLRFAFKKLDIVGVLRPPCVHFCYQKVHDIRQAGAIGLRSGTVPD
jgi:hypothetical protein